MQIGYLGLGKMGKNMVLRLLEKGHQVVAWNRSEAPRQEVAMAGATAVDTIEALVKALKPPRVIWLMLPAGEVNEATISQLSELLSPGDTIIDGANEFYKEAIRRANVLQAKEIQFLDAGVSGGPGGARHGACVMIGGERKTFQALETLFKDISAPNAYKFFQGNGAGHFVKMVHNGIEYGMMQAIAEGFDIIKQSEFNLDLEQVADIYNNGSVIESRLMEWMQSGYQTYGSELESISGAAGSGGAAGMDKSEAKWTLDVAQGLHLPAQVIKKSVEARINSQQQPNYQGKVINTLRNQFGGHSVSKD